MSCSPPDPSVHGILQARILEWVAIPFFRECSQPRDWTWVSCIAGIFFTHQESPERQTNSLWESWNWHWLKPNSYQVGIYTDCFGGKTRRVLLSCHPHQPRARDVWVFLGKAVAAETHGEPVWRLSGFCPIEPLGGVWRCITVCLGPEEGVPCDHQNREIRETCCRDKRIGGEKETVRKLWRVWEHDIWRGKGIC